MTKGAAGLLGVVLAAGAVTACGGDAWLHESNPSGNALFDLRLATDVQSFWNVSASQVERATQMLETRSVVPVSSELAAQLIGRVPDIPPGESLYLVRAIELADPAPLHVYQAGAWVQISAGTYSSCFVSRPSIHRQPVVLALPKAPTRFRLSYSCRG